MTELAGVKETQKRPVPGSGTRHQDAIELAPKPHRAGSRQTRAEMFAAALEQPKRRNTPPIR